MKSVFATLLFSILILTACTTVKYKKLTYLNTYQLESGKLKTEGYFFNINDSSVLKGYLTAFLLYKNGTVGGAPDIHYTGHSAFTSSLKSKENVLGFWGVYRIDQDTLKVQTIFLDGENNFASVWDVREDRGVIKNDTTLLFFDYRIKRKIYKQNKTYHFQEYDSKPNPIIWSEAKR